MQRRKTRWPNGRGAGYCGAVLLGLVFLAMPPRSANAQGATPGEIRQAAATALSRGEFMDAIPLLQQLVEWYGNSKNTQVVAGMEMIVYQLGTSYFFVGQFGEAEKAFDAYLQKYRYGSKRHMAELYKADALRLRSQFDQALSQYDAILRRYSYPWDLQTDIYSGMARCHLAQDKWEEAIEPLRNTYAIATDTLRRNWAATMLCAAFFKKLDLDKVYPLTPFILKPDSFASRSVVFSMAALEAGDELFATERYRDALWVFRMVYSYESLRESSEAHLERLRAHAEWVASQPSDPRVLMRLQESIGELEAEVEAINQIDNYDMELTFRIARGYMELARYWESREMFLHLHEIAREPQAEEALYLAFQSSARLLPWDRCFEIGNSYMEQYPSGEYFDVVSLLMGQMYARQQNWPEVIRHLTHTLTMRPNHGSAADCMFLIGYASFMEEQFEDALKWLGDLLKRFPKTELAPDATYWSAMALHFSTKYEQAATYFDRVIERFSGSIYLEDSSFRRAVCDYGLGRYEAADERLAAFIEKFPQSTLASEATMMRGDIAGSVGDIDSAVRLYQAAMKDPEINIEFYNHCAFQAGTMLVDEERYADLTEHFQAYIREQREGSNVPQAVYWVGVALWNQEEREGALRYYRRAVELFGKDPAAIGIDMILDEWIGRSKRAQRDEEVRAWREMEDTLLKAENENNVTLALRLKRILLLRDETVASVRQRIRDEFSRESTIPHASPAVLQLMLDMAAEDGRNDFAVKVADHIVEHYTETDYALDARMTLAHMHMELAGKATTPLEVEEHHAHAIRHLQVIREVFASSGEAGVALMLLGRIYTEQEAYDKADEAFKDVLGVRDWRNLWPEALYGRGEVHFAQRAYDVASAYYERIYLMYAHYAGWAAKAYVRRAECMRGLYQDQKAREVLEEMLRDETLARMPEAEQARQLLQRLGGTSL